MEKIEALEKAGKNLLMGEKEAAKTLINEQYPFRHMEATRRAYTDKQKMQESVRIDTGGDGKTVRGDNAGGQQVGERCLSYNRTKLDETQ